MFRIRRVYDTVAPGDRSAVEQVQAILRSQFPQLGEDTVTELPARLHDPIRHRFRAILFVAENGSRRVTGFALLMHAPDLDFCFLDFISAGSGLTGRGIGGVLYDRVRQEAMDLGVVGVFMECLPDDPALSPDPEIRRQNAARLRFYERFGARPIAGTAYETPIRPGEPDPPYLVFDDLGSGAPLGRDRARAIVRAILARKYAEVCPPEYVAHVLASFRDDPVKLRPARVSKPPTPVAVSEVIPEDRRIVLCVSDSHWIHHVRERGYVESPVRVSAIERELAKLDRFLPVVPKRFGDRHLTAVHAPDYVRYLKRVCARLPEGVSVYPYVFPIRNQARPPYDLAMRAGYYCIDTFTPLNRNAYLAARKAVDCALTVAEAVLDGRRLAYALIRPPGHHAERRSFGGFCYFNNAAVAAERLSLAGPVAILDIDYHHGNGQQDIFYSRPDVFTVSLHGHPRFAYPYFSGFQEERGIGAGLDANLNLPLSERLDGAGYREHLLRALRAIRAFAPRFLVVCLGLDTAKADPTGTWSLTADDFARNGEEIGALSLPTVVVQEGGYNVRTLGTNARRFLAGLWSTAFLRETGPSVRRPVAQQRVSDRR